MVHYGVTSPYLSPAHPEEGDDLGRGNQNRDVFGSYTWRHKDIIWVGAGSVATRQPDNEIARYGKD
jgi:hypothetical protein